MTSKTLALVGAALCVALFMDGCKRKEPAVARAPADAATAPAAPAAPAVPTAPSAPSAATPTAAAGAGAGAVKPFDVASVPVATAPVPPFPYVDLPKTGVNVKAFHVDEKRFDRLYVVAGDGMHPVEGHYMERWFGLRELKMSPLEAFRNFDAAFRAMGAVRVDKVNPAVPAFIERNGGDKSAVFKRLHVPNLAPGHDEDVPNFAQYLLRTPDKNIWLSYMVFDNDGNISLVAMEEKAMEQTVKPLTASDMAGALGKAGHIALYLNFDTDSDTIRPDSRPTVDEIAKLLRDDGKLKLAVEGHTDNTGDAQHNSALSLKRAQSVVNAVASQGIDAGRLKAVGLGATKPLADNGSEDGRARNRRVELVKT